ncbi:helix-turn-helix domain-containing protein [Streptomyces sp. NPDC059568]|uniref:helix-turn-helix domain-containing protein n=1 Tax=Streptomyces sp. NPDC059568 TaxID=3346868 RepID=UPI00368A12E9
MKWNLRLTAANKGIWKASELQRSLAEHGLVISAGKMSGLWSGRPVSLKLEDLDVICVVLGCEISDLLIPEPGKVRCPGPGSAGWRPGGHDRLGGGPGRRAQAPRRPFPAADVTWSPSPWGRSARTSGRPLAQGVSPGGSCPAGSAAAVIPTASYTLSVHASAVGGRSRSMTSTDTVVSAGLRRPGRSRPAARLR